jgi:hypothetical protein
MGEMICAYKVLVGKPEGRRTLGRTRSRWEGNIEVDVQQQEDTDLAHVNLWVP